MLMSLTAFGQETFTNPILPSGADPWVTRKDGYYYFTNTVGNRIVLYKTEKLHALKSTTPKTVWTPPATGPNSKVLYGYGCKQ
jgi:GH43 family beta-xylosidase